MSMFRKLESPPLFPPQRCCKRRKQTAGSVRSATKSSLCGRLSRVHTPELLALFFTHTPPRCTANPIELKICAKWCKSTTWTRVTPHLPLHSLMQMQKPVVR